MSEQPYDDEEDWEEDYPDEEDEVSLENLCAEPGCGEDGRFGQCGCCGGPLCFMHEELGCGFCSDCSSSPDFGERMRVIYNEINASDELQEKQNEQATYEFLSVQAEIQNESTLIDDEIPF